MKTRRMLFSLLFALVSLTLFAQNYDIWVSDAGGFNNPPWKIVKFDMNGGNPDTIIDTNLGWPQDIVFLEEDHVVLISNLNTNNIAKFDITTGEYLGDFATGINGPTRMKIHDDGLLYALQWNGNGRVFRYELDGTFVDEFTDMDMATSIGIDWDSEGNLYVSSWSGNGIEKFNADGEHQGTFANTNLNGPTNIWFDEDDNLYALNWSGTTVSQFDSEGAFVGSFITGVGQPEGVAFLENGNILLGNGSDASVRMYDSEGNFLENVVPPGGGGLIQPNAVVLRETVPNSLSEIATSANFLYPTAGTVFYTQQDQREKLESIAVYTLDGQLIYQAPLSGNEIWDATGHPDGMYIIVATTSKQRKLSQQVMVSRE